jgi:hypothetical protein
VFLAIGRANRSPFAVQEFRRLDTMNRALFVA